MNTKKEVKNGENRWKVSLNSFSSLCNPIFWYFFLIYGVTKALEMLGLIHGNFWARMWLSILDFFFPGELFNRPYMQNFIVFWFPYHSAKGFWIVAAVYLIVTKQKLFSAYKIQSADPNVSAKSYFKIFFICSINLYIVSPLFLRSMIWIVDTFMSSVYTIPDDSKIIPSFGVFMWELWANSIVQEISFYYIHRLLHTKYLYKHLHKTHHEYSTPFPMIAIYCHPVEMFLLNSWAGVGGFLLIRGHLSTAFVWVVFHGFTTMADHSGYHVPFFNSPYFHDHHHEKFTGNFGINGWMDYLHGTDGAFMRSPKAKKNHLLLPFMSNPYRNESIEAEAKME